MTSTHTFTDTFFNRPINDYINCYIKHYINYCTDNRFNQIIRDTVSKYAALFVFTVCMLISLPSFAQLSVEIGGNGTQQYPVAILGFTGGTVADEVTATLRNDLTKTGLFRLVSVDGLQSKVDVQQIPNIADLRNIGADFVIWGTVISTANNHEIKLRIQDAVRGTPLDSISLNVRANTRFAGHQIADYVYEKITGKAGFFTTRLAYITQLNANSFELRVADWDGQYPQVALRSRESIISPSFNVNGNQLAYVSFESRKASMYIHDLVTGTRRNVANFKGSNSAPAFSPNGQSIAAALSRGGLAQIYSMNVSGDNLKRLTTSENIDTEPVYSADGQSLYFVSDRGGQPQIYRMSVNGGAAQRITFKGDYNISPAVSPDGRLLTYITRRAGRYTTAVLNLDTQQEVLVSDTSADESPNFTSNSQFVLYATKRSGRGILVLASVDGRTRNTLSLPNADIREPVFSNAAK
jgi:TolB protein